MFRSTSGFAIAVLFLGCAQMEETDSDRERPAAWVQRAGAQLFARGNLGSVDPADPAPGAIAAVFGLRETSPAGVSLELSRDQVDDLGMRHLRFTQTANGLPVYAAQVIVHVDDGSGDVIAVTGTEVDPRQQPGDARLAGADALARATAAAGISGQVVDAPELTYVATAAGETRLAWAARVAYDDADGPELDRIFADAINGELVARHPQYHRALSRRIHNANNQLTLPGTQIGQEGAPPTDVAALAAYNNSGQVHDFYLAAFARDSYDGAGAQLVSTVHYDVALNNAFWTGNQMVYGDGDGEVLTNLALAYDVAAHELTHAVTQFEAGLIYVNESGALNEAMSDILAAAAESRRDGAITANTWLVGEEVFTPATAGDALRYMDNPTLDEISYDNYPERYLGEDDNGGVHLNSGIANLAFKLLVTGGTHPRALNQYIVPALGMDQAQQIFYRALSQYMTENTDFAGARLATVQAAQELYGEREASAVHYAWDAVAVTGTPERIAPTLAITSPAAGATVDTGFDVAVSLSQGSPFDVSSAELLVDGRVVATVTEEPFTFDPIDGEPGPVELEVRTHDRSGGQTSSTTSVTIAEPPPPDTGGTSYTGGCSTGSGTGGLATALMMLGLFAWTRRRR